jgi:excisionase family DNA binding protein
LILRHATAPFSLRNSPSEEFEIANRKTKMSTKSGIEGLPQQYETRAALGGFMSIPSVMEQLRTRGQAMKVREVADLLNLDPDTVVRYANEQKIPAFKVGSRWRFDPHTLAVWIEDQNGLHVEGEQQ